MSENYDTLLTLEIQYEFISTTLFLIFYRYVRVRNLLQGYELPIENTLYQTSHKISREKDV